MFLSISNIAWTPEMDRTVYQLMQEMGFSGLEIAPTRIFPDHPYDRTKEAMNWSNELADKYGLCISSMQSIWYGRNERLFGSSEERSLLIEYTKKAILFSKSIHCKNLVFGCPKNRIVSSEQDLEIGIRFFKEIGDYAASNGTVIGLEANPSIYNTNYINTTLDAIELIEQVNSEGLKLNLDIGTMIQNRESIAILKGNTKHINHVHISEPVLKKIQHRNIHKEIYKLLRNENYQRFVSIEMGRQDSINDIKETMEYVEGVFGKK